MKVNRWNIPLLAGLSLLLLAVITGGQSCAKFQARQDADLAAETAEYEQIEREREAAAAKQNAQRPEGHNSAVPRHK